jgi:hypothetical protein
MLAAELEGAALFERTEEISSVNWTGAVSSNPTLPQLAINGSKNNQNKRTLTILLF